MQASDRYQRHRRQPWVAAGAIAVALAGCAASRPALYPNAHFEQVGQAQADADIADCDARAKEYVKSGGAAGEAAVAGGTGAAVGAAAGAAGGAVWGGHAGRGAAAGAAGGATAGVLRTLFVRREPSSVHKSFMMRCLADRGYHVLGWQ
jgi:hypothetical protein